MSTLREAGADEAARFSRDVKPSYGRIKKTNDDVSDLDLEFEDKRESDSVED